MMMMSRTASFFRIAGLMSLFLVVAEGLLRIYGPALLSSVVRSEDRGYQLIPNIQAARIDPESGLLLRFETNAFGARDRHWTDRALSKPMKIAVIGNSFVEGAQLPNAFRFTDLLERKLKDMGRDVLVMNFGVGGQNIINYLDQTRYILKRFKPEVLVIGLNDTSNFMHTRQVSFYQDQRYSYTSTQQGVTYSATPLTPLEQRYRWLKSLLRQSWLVRATFEAIQAVRVNVTGYRHNAKTNACPLPFDMQNDTSRQAFDLTARLVADIQKLAAERLLLLQIPGDDQVRQNNGIPGCDFSLPETRLADFAASHDIALVQALPRLRRSQAPTHYSGGHLNQLGHKLIAAQLATSIANRY